MENFATTIALIGIVIVVASLLSGVLEKSGLPVVAVFLALGAVLGPYGLNYVNIGFESPALHALAMLGLALLLFSDAVTLDLPAVREQKPLLWRLLGPGTIIPAALVTLAARFLLDVSWPAAAILGAALASTDPVLLRSVLRSRSFPPVPRTALRIETGVNDVVLLPVVVLSILALRSSADGIALSGMVVTRNIVGLFILGPGIGALVGWLGIIMLEQIRSRIGVRRDYESLYALGLAFTAFALAEGVGGSGFLAAFAAGLLVASQDVELCDCFLEYGEATAEMLLLLTFVALGTVLIWTGIAVIDFPTVVFAVIALVARTVVLYPVLTAGHVTGRDRRLIAFFGPRGLSSLLLTLLPVFAGIAGSERLFSVTCLVVLMSVVIHGGGIAVFLRRTSRKAASGQPTAAVSPADSLAAPVVTGPAAGASVAPTRVRGALPIVAESEEPNQAPNTITIEEVRQMQASGDQYELIDARADRNRRGSDTQASGSVRLHPDDPVRDATEKRLSQRSTLVVYCA
ncbi:MAG: cation:proton antiporter [Gemmatimonadales bacterium]